MKVLSLDVSGNYSSISLLHDDEVNTFTQTHDRKDRPDLIQKKALIVLMGWLLLVVQVHTPHLESLPPF